MRYFYRLAQKENRKALNRMAQLGMSDSYRFEDRKRPGHPLSIFPFMQQSQLEL
ncbi:hypothetical protein IQ241_14550 [Romeria aff. gracilis LEGE 07310]|uniref:Uncharacterized protein n=1 Tax=Vasconcelosia minhoensis LEGE 07310 TaxID=915328 RepID=A0A8J7DC38_9CYAN|nr:hypothetical protein [Romeria aff. gracilis LEGE 07310]